MPGLHRTKRYLRERVRPPSAFQPGSFRTLDVGRPGHHKLVIGRLKGSTTTTTQAILHPRGESMAYARAESKRRGWHGESKRHSEAAKRGKFRWFPKEKGKHEPIFFPKPS